MFCIWDSAPTGVSFTTYPEAGCEGVMVMVVNPTLKTFQYSLVAGTCSDGKVTAPGSASETGYAKEYTNKECMEINPAVGQTKSAKLSWTFVASGSTQGKILFGYKNKPITSPHFNHKL